MTFRALAPAAADDAGTLSSALGLVLDAQAVFGGPRLKRGAVVIDSGKVVSVVVEPSPGEGERSYFRLLKLDCFGLLPVTTR